MREILENLPRSSITSFASATTATGQRHLINHSRDKPQNYYKSWRFQVKRDSRYAFHTAALTPDYTDSWLTTAALTEEIINGNVIFAPWCSKVQKVKILDCGWIQLGHRSILFAVTNWFKSHLGLNETQLRLIERSSFNGKRLTTIFGKADSARSRYVLIISFAPLVLKIEAHLTLKSFSCVLSPTVLWRKKCVAPASPARILGCY